jgi:phenylacetate-coenzyme A ligase PaaK-like adenylate-forming protein
MHATLPFLLQALDLKVHSFRSPQKSQALQELRLRRLLRYARRHSPFYHERFQGLDLERCRLTDLPTLTKADFMAAFDELVTDRGVSRAGLERFMDDPANHGRLFLDRYACCHTSGSEGQPAIVVMELAKFLLGFIVQTLRRHPHPAPVWRLLLRHLRQPARIAIVTQRPGFYPTGSMFSYLDAAQIPFLRLLRLSVFDATEDLVQRLNDFCPQFLIGYTSSLEILAQEERAGRLHLVASRSLEQITNVSEPLPPAERALIENAFGVPVSDHYGMAECTALTSGCPAGPGSHVNTDLACLEVVDDCNEPVPAGTAGSKVLVTNLYNRLQPMLRYEVNDIATLDPRPCPCGSPFPHLFAVAGRTKERLWIEKDGQWRELPYYILLAGLHGCTDLAEHQVLQTGPNQFTIRVAPQPGKIIAPQVVRRLVHNSVAVEGLADALDVRIEVVPEIQRDPRTGKRARVLNLVGPPPLRSKDHTVRLQPLTQGRELVPSS